MADSNALSASDIARSQLGIDTLNQSPPDWGDILPAVEEVQSVFNVQDDDEPMIVSQLVDEVAELGHSKRAAVWAVWRLVEWGCVHFEKVEMKFAGELFPIEMLDKFARVLYRLSVDKSDNISLKKLRDAMTDCGISVVWASARPTPLLEEWRRFARLATPNRFDVFESKVDGPIGDGLLRWNGEPYRIDKCYDYLEYLWDKETVTLQELGRKIYQDPEIARTTVRKALERLNLQLAELKVPYQWDMIPRKDAILRVVS